MEDRRRPWRNSLAGVALANAFPLVGIILFDWRLAHLLVVYWVEITVGGLRRTLEATFAGQRGTADDWAAIDSRWGGRSPFYLLQVKRGSFRLHSALPSIYPQSFPRVFHLGRGSLVLSLITGCGIWVAVGGSGMFVEGLFVAGVTTLIRESTTFTAHIRSRNYSELVPQSILTPRSQVEEVALMVIVIWGSALGPSPTESTGLLFVLVYLARVGFDGYSIIGQNGRFDPLDPSNADFESADNTELSSGTLPDNGPRNVFETNRRAIWVSAIVAGIFRLLKPRRFAVFGIAVFIGYIVDGTAGAGIGASTVLAGYVVYTLVERDLRWGHLEYRVYEDGIVCYDSLLDEPQWYVASEQVTDTADRTSLLERLMGVSSVLLSRRGDCGNLDIRYLDAADSSEFKLDQQKFTTIRSP